MPPYALDPAYQQAFRDRLLKTATRLVAGQMKVAEAASTLGQASAEPGIEPVLRQALRPFGVLDSAIGPPPIGEIPRHWDRRSPNRGHQQAMEADLHWKDQAIEAARALIDLLDRLP